MNYVFKVQPTCGLGLTIVWFLLCQFQEANVEFCHTVKKENHKEKLNEEEEQRSRQKKERE